MRSCLCSNALSLHSSFFILLCICPYRLFPSAFGRYHPGKSANIIYEMIRVCNLDECSWYTMKLSKRSTQKIQHHDVGLQSLSYRTKRNRRCQHANASLISRHSFTSSTSYCTRSEESSTQYHHHLGHSISILCSISSSMHITVSTLTIGHSRRTSNLLRHSRCTPRGRFRCQTTLI